MFLDVDDTLPLLDLNISFQSQEGNRQVHCQPEVQVSRNIASCHIPASNCSLSMKSQPRDCLFRVRVSEIVETKCVPGISGKEFAGCQRAILQRGLVVPSFIQATKFPRCLP